MKKIPYKLLVLLIIIASNSNIGAQDVVNFINKGINDTTGILVDGNLNGVYVNDKTYLSVSNSINIGNYTKANGNNKSNEIMAFSKDRPFEIYTPAPWTTGANNVTIPFANKILFPVTVWVLYGNYDSVCIKMVNHLLTASNTYKTEKVGVDFSTITFMDATTNPKAALHSTYYFTNTENALKADIGFTPGHLNIYCLNTLNLNGVNYGACVPPNFRDMIMYGAKTTPNYLAHEIGHSFYLDHITGYSGMDATNVMNSVIYSNTIFLTEGQILRMHLSPGSIINSVFKARTGKITRSCPISNTATNYCPAIQKRIWADGTFPAN